MPATHPQYGLTVIIRPAYRLIQDFRIRGKYIDPTAGSLFIFSGSGVRPCRSPNEPRMVVGDDHVIGI
jgi:hypothetical protein